MFSIVDRNNMKALALVNLSLQAAEDGCDNIDFISILEIIRDYLRSNDRIFDENL